MQTVLLDRIYRHRVHTHMRVRPVMFVEMRSYSLGKWLGVLYERLDKDDQLHAVRSQDEFLAKFEVQG